ncbi:MAG TPA: hypothetical protein VGP36_00255 [Mycobacteriales bacterium]|nr:hypothetical protein [Mycobacteriales bacterium]
MLLRWWTKMTYMPWWRHLVGIPTAVAIGIVWFVVLRGSPWPPIVVIGLIVAGYLGLAVASYRAGRRRSQRVL